MQNNEAKVQAVTFKSELLRKLIHISSALIPLSYFFLGKKIILMVLIPVFMLLIIVEILKYKVDFIYNLYTQLFKHLLRHHEYDKRKIRMNGSSWLLLSEILCIIFFPKLIAITGMLLLSLADSTSALVGRVYGKKQYAPNRSYAGSITFFIVGMLVVIAMPKYFYLPSEYIFGIAAVLVTTVVDGSNFPADDNFTIPVVSSVVLYVLYSFFLPGII